jgi:hypothetical protein
LTHANQILIKDWGHRKMIGSLVTTPVSNRKSIVSSNISVTNVQLSDQGIYKCIANDLANIQIEVTKLIKVYGILEYCLEVYIVCIFSLCLLDAPKLELESGYDTKILTCNQQFIFNVSIIAVPNEEKALKLVWMKDWIQIPENSDHIILSRNTSEFAELRIDNLEFNDSGFYTLSANLLNILHSNVSLNLTVIGCRYRYISKSNYE